jgi:hypothetical protein
MVFGSCALDRLLISATSIIGDKAADEAMAARGQTLRHLLKEIGHRV